MSAISSMPANIVAWLKEREELGYIRFLTEYPALKKEIPLKRTTVAVGIDGMNIKDSFVENDEGVLIENENCRQVNIKLRFSIHAPFSSGGAACHDAFTDIIDCLTFDSSLNIDSSGCDSIVSDRDTDAFGQRLSLRSALRTAHLLTCRHFSARSCFAAPTSEMRKFIFRQTRSVSLKVPINQALIQAEAEQAIQLTSASSRGVLSLRRLTVRQ